MMTLMQLIDRLNSIREDDSQAGGYDVLTRGSSPTTMVAAEDVRVVRLKSGREAVFIGKPKNS